MWRSKYLRNLLFFSLILVTIPVISLGSLSYIKARGIIQEKVVQGNIQMMAQTQMQVEQLLQTIEGSMIQFSNNTGFSQTIRSVIGPTDYPVVYSLIEGLNKLQSYETGIQDVRLTSFDGNWMIDNRGYSGSLSETMLEEQKKLMADHGISKWVTDPEWNSVRLVKALPLNRIQDPAAMLEVYLPVYRLQKLLPNDGETQTLILDAEYRPLTEYSNAIISEPVMAVMLDHLRTAQEHEGFSTFRSEGHSLAITYRKSLYNGWNYVSLVSIERITEDSRTIGWYTAAISSIMFVILLALSYFGSRKMYQPIRRVFEATVGVGVVQGSKQRDELKLIDEHIHSLKSSQRELFNQIQGQTRQLREFFVRKLIQGELGIRDIKEQAARYQSDLNPKQMCCIMTVQIDTFEGTRYQGSDRDLLLFAVSNIISELIPASSRFDPVVVGENQVTLLKVDQGEDEGGAAKQEVYRNAEQIQRTVKEILELKVSVGISRFHPELRFAAQAYRESLEALRYRIRLGEEAVLQLDDAIPGHHNRVLFPDWVEKQLIEALLVPDLEKSAQLLREFLNMTLRENVNHREHQMILFRLLADLIREVQCAGESLPLASEHQEELFEQLFKLKTIPEIENWFMKNVLEPIVQVLGKRWEVRNKNISEQMMEIIHQEFEADLTLDTCAARLNYHPNYLKTVFRKETGTNFSDYLSQYRLNQAKQWLLETDLKIGEIAERLRYQNSQNFIRYFRKMENMTPGDYRKQYKQV